MFVKSGEECYFKRALKLNENPRVSDREIDEAFERSLTSVIQENSNALAQSSAKSMEHLTRADMSMAEIADAMGFSDKLPKIPLMAELADELGL
jgi:transcriptional regulator GlxA family with amidase domain